MRLTILSVAYPFALVGPDSPGGAEQVLHGIDQGLARAGHHSIVVASEGSTSAGTLVPVPWVSGAEQRTTTEAAWERHRAAILAALQRWPIDLIHMHGVDFHGYLPPPGLPVLVTLHLPSAWYPADALRSERPDTWLHCVSQSQHRDCPEGLRLLAPIPNGVPVDALAARHAKRHFALSLGRICPEKGVHIGIDAARRADVPLLVAGNVSGHEAHIRYFEEEVRPRFDQSRRYLGPAGFRRKRRLLTAARCLVLPALASETSSLVTMEALACGTPVVAFRSGAIPEIIEHGRTGFLVDDECEMAEAIRAAADLDPDVCREAARERFLLDHMVGRYLAVYAQLVRRIGESTNLVRAA